MNVIKELKLKDYVTLLGTFCGITSIFFSLEQNIIPLFSAFFISLANIMDTLDGYVARKMNQINEIGKELDSLSDSICFGVAPAILVYSAYAAKIDFLRITIFRLEMSLLLIACAIYIIAAIVRLAWFNVDESEGYTGLPTPISAGFVVALFLLDFFWSYLPTEVLSIIDPDVMLSTVISYAFPVVLIILSILNVAPFLMYGKIVRKKSGIVKKLLILIAFLTLLAWILSFTYSTPIWGVTSFVIIGIICFVLGLGITYITFGIIGFVDHRKLKAQSK